MLNLTANADLFAIAVINLVGLFLALVGLVALRLAEGRTARKAAPSAPLVTMAAPSGRVIGHDADGLPY